MVIAHSFDDVTQNLSTSLTIGTFDGLHTAHAQIMQAVVQQARLHSRRSAVITFEPHPKEVTAAWQPMKVPAVQILSTKEEKIQRIGEFGVDILLIIPFTPEFAQISFYSFYKDFVVRKIGVSEVVEGYDHTFGKNGEGKIHSLRSLGNEFGFEVTALDPIMIDDEPVSSSRIRMLLSEGKIPSANTLLGRRYHFSGKVVEGNRRGQTLGFPTANVEIDNKKKILPRSGVSIVRMLIDGGWHEGIMNIGVVPTFFENHETKIEVHLFEFSRKIYGSPVTVECIEWLRPEIKFESAESLAARLREDVRRGKEYFSKKTELPNTKT